VVPEVNANEIPRDGLIVANPNCSTIQLAVAMAPLDKAFVLEDIHVATYQSVSGAGAEAVERWQLEVDGGIGGRSPFTAPIHGNVIPAIGEEDPNCYYTEELKLINELPKILGRDLSISATAVRVPVAVGHSEAVQVQLAREASTSELVEVLQKAPGIHLRSRCDIPLTPREIEGTDVVYVSRVRPHPSRRDTFLLWIVADNLRKGAATNAIQVIEHWHENLQGGSAG
jgi:aspartate-semialdehyde dehydrogenase